MKASNKIQIDSKLTLKGDDLYTCTYRGDIKADAVLTPTSNYCNYKAKFILVPK